MSQTTAQYAPINWGPSLGRDLLLVLLLALLIRLLTFNGAFGSDDLVYFERALQLAHGEWSSSGYNGALRYGFNLPSAAFIALFGDSLFVANLWPLTCSLIEVGAVFWFASAAMSRRTGIFSALLLATAPLHIAVATRIHADPVVSMFITVSFVLVYFGTLRRHSTLLFSAGLTIGGIFWTKELAAVTWFALLPMLWLFRDQWRNLIYVIIGIVLMMILHGLLMQTIAGDPLHLIKVVLNAVKRNFVDGGDGEDSPIYYLRYMFIDLRHVGFLGYFSIASLVVLPYAIKKKPQFYNGFLFALTWWIALLVVLSLFPVSLSPLRWTMKQSNYITLFLAPTAILAGMTISAFPKNLGRIAIVLCCGLGILLGLLQQADYRSFTANSKALADFAIQHPHSVIVGSVNNSGLGSLWARQSYPATPSATIIDFREVSNPTDSTRQVMQHADTIFTVFDQQTMAWFAGKSAVTKVLPCWQHIQTLQPTDLGNGNRLAKFASDALAPIAPLSALFGRLSRPKPADIYRVIGPDVLCP